MVRVAGKWEKTTEILCASEMDGVNDVVATEYD